MSMWLGFKKIQSDKFQCCGKCESHRLTKNQQNLQEIWCERNVTFCACTGQCRKPLAQHGSGIEIDSDQGRSTTISRAVAECWTKMLSGHWMHCIMEGSVVYFWTLPIRICSSSQVSNNNSQQRHCKIKSLRNVKEQHRTQYVACPHFWSHQQQKEDYLMQHWYFNYFVPQFMPVLLKMKTKRFATTAIIWVYIRTTNGSPVRILQKELRLVLVNYK